MAFKQLFIIALVNLISNVYCQSPNIVIFLADDLGSNDIGMHGSSQIPTPNIDALGYNGVAFKKHYTLHTGTPSRAALLTGNYPIRSGMQGAPLKAGEPRALPRNMATLAEKLLTLEYKTHLVGKWHLGHETRAVTPLGRGFQTHLGIWNRYAGYYDYEHSEGLLVTGFDLHNGYKPAFDHAFTYATDLFTDEANTLIQNHDVSSPMFLLVSHLAPHTGTNGTVLETPSALEALIKYDYIDEEDRRVYADIVNRLDTSVGSVVQSLKDKGMLDNTILVFLSDNGSPTTGNNKNYGSNWPDRGQRETLFEGGVKNVGMIWSKLVQHRQHVDDTLFHMVDWMPTLYAAAGGDVSDLGQIDGINHWPRLSQGTPNTVTRRDVLLNIDEKVGYSAILSSDGRYKLTQGSSNNGAFDKYFGDSGRASNTPPYDVNAVLNSDVNSAIVSVDSVFPLTEGMITSLRVALEVEQSDAERKDLTCNTGYCLFDLEEDPTETTDIFSSTPQIANKLITSLNAYRDELVPQTNKEVDTSSNPLLCLFTWFTWKDPVKKCDI